MFKNTWHFYHIWEKSIRAFKFYKISNFSKIEIAAVTCVMFQYLNLNIYIQKLRNSI